MPPKHLIHLYAPDLATRDALLTTFRTFPPPALGVENITGPDQLVFVFDCFLVDLSALEHIPNPVVVIHSPHVCISKLINSSQS